YYSHGFCASPSLGLRGFNSSCVTLKFLGACFGGERFKRRFALACSTSLFKDAASNLFQQLLKPKNEAIAIASPFGLLFCSSYKLLDAGLEKFCAPFFAPPRPAPQNGRKRLSIKDKTALAFCYQPLVHAI